MTKASEDLIENVTLLIEAGGDARTLVALIVAEAKARAMEDFARAHIGSANWVAEVAYARAAEYRKGK